MIMFFLLLIPFALGGAWWSIDQSDSVTQGKHPSAVAWAFYSQDINTTGWATLTIQTNEKHSNEAQARAAGFLEGFLTSELITMSWEPTKQVMFPGGVIKQEITKFFQDNVEWMRKMVKENPYDVYWQQAGLLLTQVEGIALGQSKAAPSSQKLNLIDIMLLNSDGDMGTLTQLFYSVEPGLTTEHCSVLIKLSNDFKELYSGHTTWGSYPTMLRIYKTYQINFNNVKSAQQSFSSYPAYVSSNDDFYMTDQHLVVMETTNDVWNKTLINLVKPTSLMSWARAVLANRLSTSGEEWTKTFAKYNSGTYNNQWMVLDHKKFIPNKPLQEGLLWIVEQIPGYCRHEDVTDVLSYGYWPSYNVPFFKDIYELSGYPEQLKKVGNLYSYSLAPRAEIFRRDQGKITDFTSFQKILRYNDYQHDPFSNGNPSWAIASRSDLTGQGAFGGLDTKATTAEFVPHMIAHAISGPSTDQQAPFTWASYPNSLRTGQPEVFNFSWVIMKPVL